MFDTKTVLYKGAEWASLTAQGWQTIHVDETDQGLRMAKMRRSVRGVRW